MYFEVVEKKRCIKGNQRFGDYLKPLVEYVFNSNKIVFSYKISSQNNFENRRHKILSPSIRKETDIYTVDIEYNGRDGIFEKVLKNHIQSQDYSALILTGASGSGKTSIVNYIKNNYDKCDQESCMQYSLCERRKKVFLYYDFLEGNENDALVDYDFRLNTLLMEAITDCFDEITMENFITYCEIPSKWNDTGKPKLIQVKTILNINNLNNESPNIERVVSEIKKYTTEIKHQNLIFIEMLRYIRAQFPQEHKGCFTIIFDNIDRLSDEKQVEIIKNIVSLHNGIKCKLLISVRLTTLYKFNDFFSNTTCLVENAGSTPIDIIYHRIKSYYDNRTTLDSIMSIRNQIRALYNVEEPDYDPDFLLCFDNIMLALLKYLSPIIPDIGESNKESRQINDRKERLQKSISALSGLSVRRGLELSKRFFDLFTYNYNEEPSVNGLISALTYTSTRGVRFTDPYTTNLYGRYDDDRRNSWLLYKILNILKVCQDQRLDLTVYQLYDIVNLYEKENLEKEVIVNAINVLIDSKKRLAYLSGVSNLNIEDWDRHKNRQKIHITLSGKEYFSFLATELSYIQNCFAAIDWKPIGCFIKENERKEIIGSLNRSKGKVLSAVEADLLIQSFMCQSENMYIESIPKVFNASNIVERMEFIRIGIEILLYHDIIESYYFNNNKYITEKIQHITYSFSSHFEKINSFPSLRLILAASDTFLRIINSQKYSVNIEENIKLELSKWQQILSQIDLWHKFLFNTNKSHIENLTKEISNFIEKDIL